MKKTLLPLTTAITIGAISISGYITTLPNLTEAQTNLANTANSIAIGGATALFGLLNEDEDDQNDKNT